jgi:hypothetical protein
LTYDTAGRPDQVKRGSTVLTESAWNADGTLLSRADDGITGTTGFTYDWAGRLTTTSLPSGLGTGNVTQSWRLDGLLRTKSWPSSDTATLAYEPAKRPIALSFGSAGSLSPGLRPRRQRDQRGLHADRRVGARRRRHPELHV